MRPLLLAFLVLTAFPAARAQDENEEIPKIRRDLAGVRLGDDIEEVRRAYPPAQEWPTTELANAGVTRYKLERGTTKVFPAAIEALYLGFKKGRVVEIEAVYNEKKSGAQTVERLAGEYALDYGKAKRSDERFWWTDGKTVLRVFPAEVPVAKDGVKAVAWRTAVQIFERGLSSRPD